MVEKSLFGSKKVKSWLYNYHKACWKNLGVDLWKCFHGVEYSFEFTPKWLRMDFKSSQSLKRVLSGSVKAGYCLQDAQKVK